MSMVEKQPVSRRIYIPLRRFHGVIRLHTGLNEIGEGIHSGGALLGGIGAGYPCRCAESMA